VVKSAAAGSKTADIPVTVHLIDPKLFVFSTLQPMISTTKYTTYIISANKYKGEGRKRTWMRTNRTDRGKERNKQTLKEKEKRRDGGVTEGEEEYTEEREW